MVRSAVVYLSCALCLAGCAGGSGDHRAVLDLSSDFFDAMERHDVEFARRLVVPEGCFVSVRPGADGREIRSFTNDDWLRELAEEEQVTRERFTGSPFIMIEGDVAMLWGAYALDLDGES